MRVQLLAAQSFTLAGGSSVTLFPGSIIGANPQDFPIGQISSFAVASWMVGLDGPAASAIAGIGGTRAYTISTSLTSLATSAATASGSAVLTFASLSGAGFPPFPGVSVTDLTTPAVLPAGVTVLSKAGTTVTLSANATGAGVGSGDVIVFGGLLPPGWSGPVPSYFGGTGPNYANV